MEGDLAALCCTDEDVHWWSMLACQQLQLVFHASRVHESRNPCAFGSPSVSCGICSYEAKVSLANIQVLVEVRDGWEEGYCEGLPERGDDLLGHLTAAVQRGNADPIQTCICDGFQYLKRW